MVGGLENQRQKGRREDETVGERPMELGIEREREKQKMRTAE